MKAEELRIGNLVTLNEVTRRELLEDHIFATSEYILIKQIWHEDMVCVELDDEIIDISTDEVQPIPLTEEILLKTDFIKDEILEFYRNDKGNSTIIIDYDFICLLGYSHVKIKSVHQLQNLVYALTNQELNIEL